MIGATLCSGIGAPECAAPWIDWRWHAEIEAFPAAVHAQRFPGSVNLGDMTAIDLVDRAARIALPDVIVAGTPCFTAGHLVLSADGYVPIEDIRVGDLVMTHKGRLRRVVRVGSKLADVGQMRGVGMRQPLTCTADHPFLSVNWRSQNTRRGGSYARIERVGEPEWIPASEMPGRQWCSLTVFDGSGEMPKSAKFTPHEAMYLAGMYLGDGHVRGWSSKKKKALVLSLNPAKLAKLAARIDSASFCVSKERTSVRATICDTALCDWLLDNFGRLSHAKRLPAWVLGHEHRAALLGGYLDSDGSAVRSGVSIATTSRALAYGAADLLNAEGYAASVGLVETPDTCVIEGRTVNQRDWYQVRAFHRDASRKSRIAHGYLLRQCSSFTPAGRGTVFDIEVDDDHSYVVNGAVVHNCQAFSIAGLRGSLSDARGNLTLTFVRICDAIDDLRRDAGLAPLWVVWENVPGVLSVGDNAFGSFLAGMVGGDAALEPPRGRGWTDAGVVSGPGRCAAWRVLDAQHFGLAQRRRRVFVVARGGSGSWAAADALLPVTESVHWHPAPRREARKGIARPIAASSPGGSGYRNDADTADNLIVGTLRGSDGGCDVDHVQAGHVIPLGLGEGGQLARALNGCHTASGRHDVSVDTFVAHAFSADGFDASEDGTGRGTPLVPVHAFDARQSDVIQYGDHAGPLDTDGHSQAIAFTQNSRSEVREIGGDGTIVGAIAADHGMQQQNYVALTHNADDGEINGPKTEGYAAATLRALRDTVGAEAFAEWGSGILDPLQSSEVLRAWLHGSSVRRAADEGKPGVDDGALSRAKELPAGELRLLWERGPDGRSPQGRELAKQLAVELGASLPQLPHQGASERLQVRRLTPREAERLQGFPDDWTLIPISRTSQIDGLPPIVKMAADGPRYKALGNSMAVPVMHYILQRITVVGNGE